MNRDCQVVNMVRIGSNRQIHRLFAIGYMPQARFEPTTLRSAETERAVFPQVIICSAVLLDAE